jgi:hypothetical protein
LLLVSPRIILVGNLTRTNTCADEDEESQQWENEFLVDNEVKTPLERKAVALRLLAGSEEAGYLEALFPVPRKPTVIVIQ